MDPIRVAAFQGANLALHPKLLPPEIGVVSLNQKPGKGDLRPWKVPLNVATTSTAGRKTLYRFNADVASDVNYWFQWSTIVHVVRGFIADDTTERTYFSGSGTPKVTDNTMALAGAPYPTAARELGVPVPLTAPILTETTPGTGSDEDRFYVYTYVTDIGEESAPSPVSAVFTCKPGAIIAISNMAAPPAGNYGINRIRIYRTQAGTSGNAEFFFLREILTATTSEDDARALGTDTLTTNGPAGTTGRVYLPPPANLKCLTGMWNGMMAGIVGKSVRYCEPGKPYAWPAAFETLMDTQPVALATFQKNLLILTTGKPRLVVGSAPEVLDDTNGVGLIAACVSVQSVVSFDHGAVWATPEGLAYVGTAGDPRILTDGLVLKEDWQALNPSTIVAAQYAGRYMGFYDSGAGVWKGFMLDPLAPAGLYFFDFGFSAVYFDALQETLYGLNGTDIQKWDAGASNLTVTFKTKEFRLPRPENPGAAEVIADFYPVQFKLWADGVLRLDRSVTSKEPFLLPSGYEADVLQLEGSGAGPITAFAIAGDIDGLKPV